MRLNGFFSKKLKSKGFTLAELMVSMSLLATISTAVFGVLQNTQNSFTFIFGQTSNFKEARFAISQISRDLRATTQITAASANSITFLSDVNNDNTDEEVTYSLVVNGNINNLQRTVGGVTRIVARGVTNTNLFTYRDENSQVDPGLEATRTTLIEINLSVDIDPTELPLTANSQSGTVFLRNLQINEI